VTELPDAWSALRARPWRFLVSRWPWRSLFYLGTTVPAGLLTGVALFTFLTVGLLAAVLVVGLVVLAEIPFLAAAVAQLERRRAGLVLPAPANAARATLTERRQAGRAGRVVWPEIGAAVLLGSVFWVVDLLVVMMVVTVPAALLAAPWADAGDSTIALGPWHFAAADHVGPAAMIAVVWFVASAYPVTALAVAQAALTRVLVDPQPARLEAAVAQLRRSRVDLVDAFETERRRIERDLHDGAQQQLVALTMTLGRAELEVPDGPGAALIQQAHRQAEDALEHLRSTVRGIHPPVLADHGLAAAVHEITDRLALPAHADLRLPARLPEPVEAAAYFLVSEALTNVVRHADAGSVRILARVVDSRLEVSVTDDGRGGATPVPRGGLAGLATRIEALDGELRVVSPPGGPTEVSMRCPIGA
jgi:signal transduction histidine kinase